MSTIPIRKNVQNFDDVRQALEQLDGYVIDQAEDGVIHRLHKVWNQRPVYRKHLDLGTGPGSPSQDFASGLVGVQTIVDLRAWLHSSTSVVFLPYDVAAGGQLTTVFILTTTTAYDTVRYSSQISWGANYTLHVEIDFTLA